MLEPKRAHALTLAGMRALDGIARAAAEAGAPVRVDAGSVGGGSEACTAALAAVAHSNEVGTRSH